MNKVPGQYKHKEIEKKWQNWWLQNKTYKWNEDCSRDENYVIDTPPPTVSGLLHMGHIYSYTQADIIARYQRMKGKNVFYPMGFDDNGLPTERLVEKVKKIKSHQMKREDFRKVCHQVVEEAEEEFYNLFNSVGLSVDWDQKYQTISQPSRKISQMSFLDLYKKGECYRAMEPCLWDPQDGTALAQADIEDKEVEGYMNYITFSTEEEKELIIATTRPELLPACVAVLFNPRDERYKHLLDKTAITPLFNIEVPLIADETVEIDKGTGLVMCCTFGDTADIEWWKKHNLPLRIIIDAYGKIRIKGKNLGFTEDESISSYVNQLEGVKITQARDLMIELLKQNKKFLKQERVIKQVKCAERSGCPIEIQVFPQWFIRILNKKEAIKEKASECKWFPEYMQVRLKNWVDGLNWDWCISRQRYFGVPFPVWYSKRKGEEGKIILADIDQLPVDPLNDLPKGYSKEEVEPDLDIMDTWATSSITPQINSRAISQEYSIDYERHQKLYPADLRPQAHEIIRTWTFYTLVKSLYHENSIPWKNIMISGWCLAEDKTKMSKSKGNVITPTSLIENKGADVVRYWASTSKLGADIVYSEKLLDVGKKLLTKLWNATKFVAMHLETTNHNEIDLSEITSTIDKWLIYKLHLTINDATIAFEKYEYADAKRAIENFFWNDFCDNYLEIVKIRVYDQNETDPVGQKSAQITLSYTIEILLRLLAPFLPHITEELYATLFPEKKLNGSIHRIGNWPRGQDIEYPSSAKRLGQLTLVILELVRKAKSEKQLSMKYPIEMIAVELDDEIIENLNESDIIKDLKNVTNSKNIVLVSEISKNDVANSYICENNKIKLKIKFDENNQ